MAVSQDRIARPTAFSEQPYDLFPVGQGFLEVGGPYHKSCVVSARQNVQQPEVALEVLGLKALLEIVVSCLKHVLGSDELSRQQTAYGI